jgi:AcrR family transcriptional regulator
VPRETRRGKVLRTAAALFATNGFAATSLSQLARRSGVSKPGIYYHVRDKEELLFRICFNSMTGILDAVRAAVAASEDTAAQLRGLIRAHLTYHWRHPGALVTLFGQKGYLSQERRRRVMALEREYLDVVRSVIREGQRQGFFRRVDPTIAAFALFAMLNTIDGWYDPRGRIGRDDLVGELERVYLGGLVEPTRKRRPRAATPS